METTKPRKKSLTWSPELEVATHHLTDLRGLNNEGWIAWKSVEELFNADGVIASTIGGLSPAKAPVS